MKRKNSSSDRNSSFGEKWDEMWCAIRLHVTGYYKVLVDRQCEHADATGRYVFINTIGDLCGFDPPTRLQALSWVNEKPERMRRIKWLCHECGQVMPLGDSVKKTSTKETT